MKKPGELIRFTASVRSSAGPRAAYDALADLSGHLVWAGRRSTQKSFRLLELEAPEGPATVGTHFTSTGANNNGTFRDSSVVTDATAPSLFAFRTDSRLDREHGTEWRVTFVHRYEVQPVDGGSRITYTCIARDGSYVPYWLRPGVRRMTRVMVGRMMDKQLQNLARLAEERAGAGLQQS